MAQLFLLFTREDKDNPNYPQEMKKKFKYSLLLCVFCVTTCQNEYTKKDLYGKWVGVNQNTKMVLKLREDSKCELIFHSGPSTMRVIGEFEVDFSKKPIPLAIRRIPQLNHPLHTIIEFKGKNEIKLERFATRLKMRPIIFSQDRSMILRKRDRHE